MKVDVKDCEGLKKEITFEIPADIISQKIDEAYNELKKTVNLKGFRRGKIPRQLLKVHFSKTVEKEVLEEIIPEYYKKALQEADLSAVGKPEFSDDPHIKEGEALAITVQLEVKPTLDVIDYKGIKLTRKPVVIKDEDIEKALNALREENSVFTVIDNRPVKKGDGVIMDYEYHYNEKITKKEGVFIDLAKDHNLEDKLVGMNKGEEKDFEVDFPDDYYIQELRGKKVMYNVRIKEIKEKSLPDLDDEFAKDLGDYRDLESLKQEVISRLKNEGETAEKQRLEIALVDTIIERNPIDDNLIQPIVNHQIEALAHNFRMSKEEIEKDFGDKAAKDVKASLLLEQIAKQENITVDEDEFDYEIVNRARELNMDYQKVKEKLDKSPEAADELRSEITVKKTVSILMEQAIITDEEIDKPKE
ncbi:MAG: trigger factor [bacterium]